MKMTSITIVVLTYNHVDTISKCLDSVLAQKFDEKKIEAKIILLDDCSTDGTSEICMNYARNYSKIDYQPEYKNTSGKLFYQAIESIESDYFCFIDGDDWYLNNSLIQNGIDFLEMHKEYSVYGQDTLFVTSSGEYSYTKVILDKTDVVNPICLDNYVFIHPVSRILRRVCNYKTEFKNTILSDLPLYVFNLSKGKAFLDTSLIGGAYNYNQLGYYSKKTPNQQLFYQFQVWKYINFKLKSKFYTEIIGILKDNFIVSEKRYGKMMALKYFPRIAFYYANFRFKKIIIRDLLKAYRREISDSEKRFSV